MQQSTEATPLELALQQKRQAKKDYYRSNKAKIQASRRKKELEKKSEICAKEEIPDFLVEYISFHVNGEIHLAFKDKTELFGFLVYIKFKSQIEEGLFKGREITGR